MRIRIRLDPRNLASGSDLTILREKKIHCFLSQGLKKVSLYASNCYKIPIPKYLFLKLGFPASQGFGKVQCFDCSQADFEFPVLCDVRAPTPSLSWISKTLFKKFTTPKEMQEQFDKSSRRMHTTCQKIPPPVSRVHLSLEFECPAPPGIVELLPTKGKFQ